MKKHPITVQGTTYYLAALDTSILNKFILWADGILGNPLDKARDTIKGFPLEIQMAMVKQAQDDLAQRRSGQGSDIKALMGSPDGTLKLISLMFAKCHPSMTDSEIVALVAACEEEHGLSYLSDAIEAVNGTRKPG